MPNARDTVALMRGFRIYDHTEKVGEAGEGASAAMPLRHRVERRRARWNPSPSSRATRADRAERTSVAHQGVWHARGTRAIATMSRLQSCVATDSEGLLRPRVGEGRNNVLLMKSLQSGTWRWLVDLECGCSHRERAYHEGRGPMNMTRVDGSLVGEIRR
jgi:hypothetical protein